MTDDRLGLGEFGIQAQLLDADDESEERPPAPSQGDFGHTMVYSPDRAARKLDPEPVAPSLAVLAGGRRRTVLSGDRMVLGRSRDCDITVDDANVSREHAELRTAGGGWRIVDLGSTNGVKVNRRRVDQAELKHGDRITLGVTDLDFELE
jgi:predicted component of type VI protein secretion system